MNNTIYQRDLLSRVATRAMRYINGGANRHDAFVRAWEDTERQKYTVRYFVPTTFGFDEVSNTFHDRSKAEAFRERLNRTLPGKEAETVEMFWNAEAWRKARMQEAVWDAEAEFLYATH